MTVELDWSSTHLPDEISYKYAQLTQKDGSRVEGFLIPFFWRQLDDERGEWIEGRLRPHVRGQLRICPPARTTTDEHYEVLCTLGVNWESNPQASEWLDPTERYWISPSPYWVQHHLDIYDPDPSRPIILLDDSTCLRPRLLGKSFADIMACSVLLVTLPYGKQIGIPWHRIRRIEFPANKPANANED